MQAAVLPLKSLTEGERMSNLTISSVIGKLVEKYVLSAIEGKRDCRLLVPGLTHTIAEQLHQYLLNRLPQQVNSYLIIGEDEEPSEERGKIKALGLTSKRIGSFVAVTRPGQLVHIQDSIRGSGGTIRSIAFSEEWPWIDDVGSESFRFNGPVLDELVKEWASNEIEQEWLREFTLKGLLEYTRSSSKRGQVFLEEIVGTFHPSLYPTLPDVKEKFLYHAGIPRPTGGIPQVKELITETTRLCKNIVERYQKEGDTREQAREIVNEVFTGGDRNKESITLDHLIDRMGNSETLDLGILALHGCWENPGDWTLLDAKTLATLFKVKPAGTTLKYFLRCKRGCISENGKRVATFRGEPLEITILYSNIPPDLLPSGSWTIQVLSRQRPIVDPVMLKDPQGEIHLSIDTTKIGSYTRKVPLRVVLAQDNVVKVEERLDLHLCGPDRPAFVVVQHGFEVIDPISMSEDDVPDKKITIDEPVTVYLFEDGLSPLLLRNEDNENISLIEQEGGGVWKPAQLVNVTEKPSGQVTWTFGFGDLSAVICFEGGDIEKGEFTVEDELRSLISDPKTSEKQLKTIFNIFEKKDSDPYQRLGGINDAARHRLFLSKVVTNPTGWRPVLTNLFDINYEVSGSIGDFINYLGQFENVDFGRIGLPPDALVLIREYSNAREAILEEINSYTILQEATSEHPIYASHPIFVRERSIQMEDLVCKYLKAYCNILDYISSQNESFDQWHQLFVLVYLDCVVDWSTMREKNTFFLLGPWHPLVVAKRFMVQSALYNRGHRLLYGGSEGKEFRQLTALLKRVQGFKWVVSLSTRDKKIEPAFVSTTSDPGWHVAFKTGSSVLLSGGQVVSLPEISRILWKNLGLDTESGVGGNQDLPVMALSNYMNSFPSRRSIGVRICHGYNGNEVIKKVNAFLHDEEKPTQRGLELPGGVRLYLQDAFHEDTNARWTNPPFFIYTYESDEDCIRINHPDIYMSQSTSDVSFRDGDIFYDLPRGEGYNAIFYEPLKWLTGGPSLIPDSVTYELDNSQESSQEIGSAFVMALGKLKGFLRYPKEKISTVELPVRLNAPWVVIPGHALDPAILVKYVCDSSNRAMNERALWDYKVSIGGHNNSYFILSTIPRGFQVAVNGFFARQDIATQFIAELGRVGIAIGGEALKSGRRALGIIGLVGAVRLLVGENWGSSPISHGPRSVGFIIPVDSFESFFGKTGSGEEKRSDILAVQILLPSPQGGKMRISACGVESKFLSGTYSRERANFALDQARATTSDFKRLVLNSLGIGAMPERLALLELIRFGLRLSSQYIPNENASWIQLERSVYHSILQGNYEYFAPSHDALLISTEAELHGPAECDTLPGGLWIRLTKTHWPGIIDPSQLDGIIQCLSGLFSPMTKSTSQQTKLPGTPSGPIPVIEPPVIIPIPDGSRPREMEEPLQAEDPKVMPRKDLLQDNLPLQKIFIGVDDSRVAKYFDPKSPVDPLDNMNLMVTGSSGTGKTQFLKYLICKFREQNKNVLLLDFKNDFANDEKFSQRARLERIFVNFDGLPYNPLIPYPIKHPATGELFFQPRQHINGVTSVFKRTFGLGDQQAATLKNAMISAFNNAGIQTTDPILHIDNNLFPDFSQVGMILQNQHDKKTDLIFNRLESLFTLIKPNFRTVPFHELVERSIVIDLSMIPSDEIKNALAQLVVMSAHSYFNSIPHSGAVRQIFIIDEAFRVLDYEFMADFVLQCRAYGVGMMLSSQYPSQFPRDVSSSLATKVLHGNGGDSNRIKDIVQLIHSEGREGDIANLERFQAFLDNRHHPRTLIRTMNYPLYLVWEKLQIMGMATREELSQVDGFNTSMLPIGNLIQQLKRMGLADEKEGKVFVLNRME